MTHNPEIPEILQTTERIARSAGQPSVTEQSPVVEATFNTELPETPHATASLADLQAEISAAHFDQMKEMNGSIQALTAAVHGLTEVVRSFVDARKQPSYPAGRQPQEGGQPHRQPPNGSLQPQPGHQSGPASPPYGLAAPQVGGSAYPDQPRQGFGRPQPSYGQSGQLPAGAMPVSNGKQTHNGRPQGPDFRQPA